MTDDQTPASCSRPENEPQSAPEQAPSAEVAPHTDGLAAPDGEPAAAGTGTEPPLFQLHEAPRPPERIPNFGHVCILAIFLLFGLIAAGLLTSLALRVHFYGISTMQNAANDIHYTLFSEAIVYLVTLAASLAAFPLLWHKGLFRGLQWNLATAIRLRVRLISAAFACLVLAVFSALVVPGPTNAPIDKIFRKPGAAWLLFGFGVTFAPFFEEMIFRGFLLPALCTAVDWSREKLARAPRLPLLENGHPQWSFLAMAVGSVATSIPFAWLHAAQTGYSVGPFVLLAGVSLVLCAIRLSSRSLAASVVVHASYNFVLFSVMLIGTSGFRHLNSM